MAKVFITGSADGLGQLAGRALIAQGHQVVLHARNEKRSKEALEKVPGAKDILTADLGNIEETKALASKLNGLGEFDAVIHNAGVLNASSKDIFYVNVLAPYILTCLVQKPKRLIYLSSGMHLQGRIKFGGGKSGIDGITYSDSKLYVLMLCLAVARMWRYVHANSVNPGWVPTKMGGSGAPDDLQKGFETQVWLAVSDEAKAKVSGRYFFHQTERQFHPQADDVNLQEQLLKLCEEMTGVAMPKTLAVG
jgi:NAD(P)-dependent dehydrogenase (short-subunit alcohol dehydrogenase family)